MISATLFIPESLHQVAGHCNTACSVFHATLCSMDREAALRRRQGARLKAARKAAGWSRSARACAIDNGWPESTYRAHEGGTRTIGLDDAERYAKRFQAEGVSITAKSILFDEDAVDIDPLMVDSGVNLVPHLSRVPASKMAEVGHVQELADAPKIPIADLPKGDWFALTVEGDSMNRVAPDGSTILVNRNEKRLIPRKFYVFNYQGEATFKRYIDKPKMLAPFSTNPEHEPVVPLKNFLVIGRVRRVLVDL